jgi:hypothetical protein
LLGIVEVTVEELKDYEKGKPPECIALSREWHGFNYKIWKKFGHNGTAPEVWDMSTAKSPYISRSGDEAAEPRKGVQNFTVTGSEAILSAPGKHSSEQDTRQTVPVGESSDLDLGPLSTEFVEPYRSDSCKNFHEGIGTVEGNKDRLGYANERVIEREFPVVASFGHLRVDTERVMLLYKSLIKHANKVVKEVTSKIDFPITESYPARQAVLFLRSPNSQAGHDTMALFPSMVLEEQVQILKRIMGTLSIASKSFRHQQDFSLSTHGLCREITPIYAEISRSAVKK